jgi:hypothetical protein
MPVQGCVDLRPASALPPLPHFHDGSTASPCRRSAARPPNYASAGAHLAYNLLDKRQIAREATKLRIPEAYLACDLLDETPQPDTR